MREFEELTMRDFDISGIYSEAKEILDDAFQVINYFESGSTEDVHATIKSIMEHATEITSTISTAIADYELLR